MAYSVITSTCSRLADSISTLAIGVVRSKWEERGRVCDSVESSRPQWAGILLDLKLFLPNDDWTQMEDGGRLLEENKGVQ
jgi:hypothetical protein